MKRLDPSIFYRLEFALGVVLNPDIMRAYGARTRAKSLQWEWHNGGDE
jgi:hypothetical protein